MQWHSTSKLKMILKLISGQSHRSTFSCPQNNSIVSALISSSPLPSSDAVVPFRRKLLFSALIFCNSAAKLFCLQYRNVGNYSVHLHKAWFIQRRQLHTHTYTHFCCDCTSFTCCNHFHCMLLILLQLFCQKKVGILF